MYKCDNLVNFSINKQLLYISNLSTNSNLNSHDSAIVNSRRSGNYLCADAPVVEKNYTSPLVAAGTPNGSTLTSSCSTLIPNPNLPSLVRQSTILLGLTYRSLLSIGQLCNAGYDTHFDKTKVVMPHSNALTIISSRENSSGMYLVSLRYTTPTGCSYLPPTPT